MFWLFYLVLRKRRQNNEFCWFLTKNQTDQIIEIVVKMPRIDEICREKLVSDVLEEKEGLTPLQDGFLPRLEKHLCQQFGITEDSPFLVEIQQKCKYVAEQAADKWRKYRGKQIDIFKNNRGMYFKCGESRFDVLTYVVSATQLIDICF